MTLLEIIGAVSAAVSSEGECDIHEGQGDSIFNKKRFLFGLLG